MLQFKLKQQFAQTVRNYGSGQPMIGTVLILFCGSARDNPIAVGYVDQYIALEVEEAHDLKCLEHVVVTGVDSE